MPTVPKARHFLNLADAETIVTPQLQLVARTVDDAVRERAIAVIHGDAGLGKTFAVSVANETRRSAEAQVVWVDFPLRTTTKFLVKRLLELMTGIPQPGSRSQLEPALLELLSERLWLLVVDEAQRLTYECLEYLRYLWDSSSTQFGLLLVGGHRCYQVLSAHPMLESRVFRWIPFSPMTTKEVLKYVPKYHPMYRTVAPETLLYINDRHAHGRFRNWASFTKSADEIMTSNEIVELTDDVIEVVLKLFAGRRG